MNRFTEVAAMDTLAVRLAVPVIRVRRGLAPPSHHLATTTKWMVLSHHASCRAHKYKKASENSLAFHFNNWRARQDSNL